MLERALSMVLSLLNRLDDDHGDPPPEVYGCRNCGLIYDPQCYRHSNEPPRSGRQWGHCPVCSERAVEFLGPLPDVVPARLGVFLIDVEGDSQGPYQTAAAAHEALWSWFNRKRLHGSCKEEDRQESKVIRLVPKGGFCPHQESGTEGKEGN